MTTKEHHLSHTPKHQNGELYVPPTAEQYMALLRTSDRTALTEVILPTLANVLPPDARIFAVGSSPSPDYRDIDLVIGVTHNDVPMITTLCIQALKQHPRVTIQENTGDADPTFTSPKPIGFGVTVDNTKIVTTKEDARGMFDFAVPRYNHWEVLHTNGRGILLR